MIISLGYTIKCDWCDQHLERIDGEKGDVTPSEAMERAEGRGWECDDGRHWFCSTECREKFDARIARLFDVIDR